MRHIACVVLISCPHSQSDKTAPWQVVPQILKACTKHKLKHVVTSEAASGLAEDCMGFEQAMDEILVLSLYETLPTRLNGRFGSKLVVRPAL